MGNGVTYTTIDPAGGTGGGMMKQMAPGVPSAWLAYVNVDDIKAATAKAKSLGANIKTDVTEVPGMGWFSILTDPTGAALGLWQAARGLKHKGSGPGLRAWDLNQRGQPAPRARARCASATPRARTRARLVVPAQLLEQVAAHARAAGDSCASDGSASQRVDDREPGCRAERHRRPRPRGSARRPATASTRASSAYSAAMRAQSVSSAVRARAWHAAIAACSAYGRARRRASPRARARRARGG